jgi:hypothetical protein
MTKMHDKRAEAIARILAVMEAKRVEDEAFCQVADKVTEAKTAARRAACKEYAKRWRGKFNAELAADPAKREAYREQMRIKERAYYHRRKERTQMEITYEVALQAIAVARASGRPAFCKRSLQNGIVLLDLASEAWTEDGIEYCTCTDKGDEWTVKMQVQP